MQYIVAHRDCFYIESEGCQDLIGVCFKLNYSHSAHDLVPSLMWLKSWWGRVKVCALMDPNKLKWASSPLCPVQTAAFLLPATCCWQGRSVTLRAAKILLFLLRGVTQQLSNSWVVDTSEVTAPLLVWVRSGADDDPTRQCSVGHVRLSLQRIIPVPVQRAVSTTHQHGC